MPRFPAATVAVIMDNVGIHHAQVTTDWLAARPAVHRLLLPRSSPNDNVQERVWGWLRAAVCRNRAFPNLASKRLAARVFLDALSPAARCHRCVPAPRLIDLLAEALG